MLSELYVYISDIILSQWVGNPLTTALKYQNYDDSYDEFKKVKDSATFAFNSAKGNDIKRIKSSNMKIFSIVMTKVYKSFWYLLVQK